VNLGTLCAPRAPQGGCGVMTLKPRSPSRDPHGHAYKLDRFVAVGHSVSACLHGRLRSASAGDPVDGVCRCSAAFGRAMLSVCEFMCRVLLLACLWLMAVVVSCL